MLLVWEAASGDRYSDDQPGSRAKLRSTWLHQPFLGTAWIQSLLCCLLSETLTKLLPWILPGILFRVPKYFLTATLAFLTPGCKFLPKYSIMRMSAFLDLLEAGPVCAKKPQEPETRTTSPVTPATLTIKAKLRAWGRGPALVGGISSSAGVSSPLSHLRHQSSWMLPSP